MKVIRYLLTLLTLICSLIAHSSETTLITSEDIQWGLLNPARGDASPRAANLWGDRTKNTATGMLVKFNKGFSSPPHIHNISYRGVVIEGLIHNDDPGAKKLWLGPGSFWTQPAGAKHITAANGERNMIYLEIDAGPYLVQPPKKAFNNGEQAINVDESNLVWLGEIQSTWVKAKAVAISYLWGDVDGTNGSLIKLPENFSGQIKSDSEIKVVVIKGRSEYRSKGKKMTNLTPGSFFSANNSSEHQLRTRQETILYIRSNKGYKVY